MIVPALLLSLLAISMMLGLAGYGFFALFTTALALGISLYEGSSSIWALLPLAVLAALLTSRSHVKSPIAKGSITTTTALLSVAIGMHLFPGFGYISLGTTQFGQSSTSYTFGAGIDKWSVGAIILAFSGSLMFKGQSFFRKKGMAVAVFVPPTLILAGIALGVPVDIKFGSVVFAFLAMNLVVCAVEEGFYRLLIQERLNTVLPSLAAALITAFIFFITHFSPHASFSTLIIFALAGILYAITYQMTRSIFVAIGVHWASNALHIMLLRYPLT